MPTKQRGFFLLRLFFRKQCEDCPALSLVGGFFQKLPVTLEILTVNEPVHERLPKLRERQPYIQRRSVERLYNPVFWLPFITY